MEWDKITLAVSAAIFVSIFPGATVEVRTGDDGRIKILPVTHVPDEIFVYNVVHIRHPEQSFEIQVLNNDSPQTITKLIFGPQAS